MMDLSSSTTSSFNFGAGAFIRSDDEEEFVPVVIGCGSNFEDPGDVVGRESVEFLGAFPPVEKHLFDPPGARCKFESEGFRSV